MWRGMGDCSRVSVLSCSIGHAQVSMTTCDCCWTVMAVRDDCFMSATAGHCEEEDDNTRHINCVEVLVSTWQLVDEL